METTAPARSSPTRGIAPVDTGTPAPADVRVGRPTWLTVYTGLLVMLDATAMAAATLTAKISWLGINPESFHIRSFSIPYGALTLATVPAWVIILALVGAYDLGPFGTSPRVWVQVVRAGAQLLAVVAVSYYILHLAQLGRGVLVGLIPLAVVLTLGARAAARLVLDQLHRAGHARRTALLVGHQRGVDAVMQQIAAHPEAGVVIVGVSVVGTGRDVAAQPVPPDPSRDARTALSGGTATTSADPNHDRLHAGHPNSDGPNGHRAGGDGSNGTHANGDRADTDRLASLARTLARTGAETVIITGGLAQGQVRDIAWMLEGTGVALLVTPAPADLRELTTTVLRPVAGLPLLHLDR